MRNLDRLAAQTAQKIITNTSSFGKSEVDNLATKTLGVLQENGVYAAMLYLYSRTGKDKDVSPHVRPQLLALAAHEVVGESTPKDNAQFALAFITKHITHDLNTLLLVKSLWEQTLIYVRYGAKAREDGS